MPKLPFSRAWSLIDRGPKRPPILAATADDARANLGRQLSHPVPKRPDKVRADQLLVELELAPSRTQAQALILAGRVYSGEVRIDKPGTLVARDTPLSLRGTARYVSRGGEKLEGALDELAIDVAGTVCVDVGASTGGFTDCLLQRGARKIYAVDVGHGQLAAKLRADPRVVVMERVNARALEPGSFAEPIDLVVVDASFIGLDKLLPAIARVLPPGARLLALIKPQFEVGREHARRARGVIRDQAVRKTAIERTIAGVAAGGFVLRARADSRLPGPKGNVEHFVLATRADEPPSGVTET
jgi:23S rRNA (cytidine1920-2'-O)/16S rRNA (cytidine1409-2'-O)-methyltransferase